MENTDDGSIGVQRIRVESTYGRSRVENTDDRSTEYRG